MSGSLGSPLPPSNVTPLLSRRDPQTRRGHAPSADAAPHRSSDALDSERAAAVDLSWALTEISSVIGQLHSIGSRRAPDDELQSWLTAIATHLDDVVHDIVVHAHGDGHRRTTNTTNGHPAVVAAERRRLEDAFLQWLGATYKARSLRLDGPNAAATSMTAVLDQLRTSTRPLPPDTARSLGLAQGSSIGDSAAALLHAVHDPAGPRCRSFGEAARYLGRRITPWNDPRG